uniref:Uncharacterized protein n=1 Tax=Callorhinchus milii TaxID=7868 RepID=A0A4W3JCH9_CALMI
CLITSLRRFKALHKIYCKVDRLYILLVSDWSTSVLKCSRILIYKEFTFVFYSRKNLIEFESESAKKWTNKWGFLITARDQIEAEEKQKRSTCRIETPEHLKVRPATPISKYIQVEPSPPVPKTTQGFIGWRSGIPELGLERFGSIKKVKLSFVNQMKWPEDCVD